MAVAAVFALAAGSGALARAWAGRRLNRSLPWGTWIVNVSGSFALGLLAHASVFATTVLGTGLLGAYTTFSSFARDATALWEERRWGPAAAYVAGSVVACVAAAWLGLIVAG
jgi:CrcB protein